MANESDDHIALSPAIFYLLLGGVSLGGAGLGGIVQPALTTEAAEAVEACYNNAQIALNVAAQHGAEIQGLRTLILDRTKYRYTSEQASTDWLNHERSEDLQNRRLDLIENHLRGHSHEEE
jgi:hypothetical protein